MHDQIEEGQITGTALIALKRLAEKKRLRITDLGVGMCRYPITGDKVRRDGHRFCGLPVTTKKSSYCDLHRSIAYEARRAPK